MTTFIDFKTTADLDRYIIPNAIYDETINKETLKIQNYFILHPKLMYSFVGFNGALKLANGLASQKKCGCFYRMPWKTYYDQQYDTKETVLSFAQQVDEYRYMILHWKPSPSISYMQYLSQIALGMILDIKQYNYYLSNNLEPCNIFQKEYYKQNFTSPKQFHIYIIQNLPFL